MFKRESNLISKDGQKKIPHFDFEQYRKGLADEIRNEQDRSKKKELLDEMKTDETYWLAKDTANFKHRFYAKTQGLYLPERLDLLTDLIIDKENIEDRSEIMLASCNDLIFEMANSDSEDWQQQIDSYLKNSLETRSHLLENISHYIKYQDKLDRKLRDHQLKALIKIKDFIESGCLRGYIAHPTGVGKTMLFTSLIRATEARTLVIVPSKNLVKQTLEELQRNLPTKKLTYVSSSKEKDIQGENNEINAEKGTNGDVVVITDQSLKFNTLNIQESDFDFVIIDEAHNSYTSRSQHALRHFPSAIKLAFTATPDYYYTEKKPGFEEVEMEGSKLYKNPDKSALKYYPHEIDRINLKEAIESHMLADLCAAIVRTEIDLDEANTINTVHGNDFNGSELEKLLEKHWPTLKEQVLKSYFEGIADENAEDSLRYDHKQVFTVCSNVKQAEDLAKEFNERGISAACVTGDTLDDERDEIFKRYQRKEIKVLTSVCVLKEGWDMPEAEVCLMLRPTLSRTFYEQVIGRVLRLDKNNPEKVALVVDFLGKYSRMTPLTTPGLFGVDEFYNGQSIVPKKRVNPKDNGEFEDSVITKPPYKVSSSLQKIERVEQITKITDDLVKQNDQHFASKQLLMDRFFIRPDSLNSFVEYRTVNQIRIGNTNFYNVNEIVTSYLDHGEVTMYKKGFLSLKAISLDSKIQKRYLEAITSDPQFNIIRYEETIGTNKVLLFDSSEIWKIVKERIKSNLKDISKPSQEDPLKEKVEKKLEARKIEREKRDEKLILTDKELARLNFTSPPDILRLLKHVANQKTRSGAKSLLQMVAVLKPLSDECLDVLEVIKERWDFKKDPYISKECDRIIAEIKRRASHR